MEHESKTAKFWLDPARLQKSRGFSIKELNRIQELIEENQQQLRKAWEEHFED